MPDDKPIAAQIAEACGWEWENAKDSPTHILVRVDGHWRLFDPEHDANDALLAAEKFGLYFNICLRYRGPGWFVLDNADETFAWGKTFCEAICNAILKRDGR